jgi:hypothetical protein
MKTMIELITAMSTASDINEGAKAAVESGLSSAKDMFTGFYKEQGVKAKEILEAYKKAEEAAGKARIRVGGFAQDYYDWLAEESRTEVEARAYIMDPATSKNTKVHLTHYLNIWALAESVRTGSKTVRSFGAEKTSAEKAEKAPEPEKAEWEYDISKPFENVQAAKHTLKLQTEKAPKARDLDLLTQAAEAGWENFDKVLAATKKALKIPA